MKNKYDQIYKFRLARVGDTKSIMKFIHDEYNENHALANNEELFRWFYGRDEYGDNEGLNVFLMEDDQGIAGMIGFVPYSNEPDCQVSAALTIVRSKGLLPMAGLEMMKRMKAMVGDSFSFGTNPVTIKPLYEKVFGHTTGIMRQYYILNDRISDFRIARVPDRKNGDGNDGNMAAGFPGEEYRMEEFYNYRDLLAEFDLGKQYPRMSKKSGEYIRKKFFENPYYSYRKWKIKDTGLETTGILFAREVYAEGAKALRIMDFRGNIGVLGKIGEQLRAILHDEGFEYVDLMVSDIPDDVVKEAGFEILDPKGGIIIPNYFEPFLQKNALLYFNVEGDTVIFKADGDQDRPNGKRKK